MCITEDTQIYRVKTICTILSDLQIVATVVRIAQFKKLLTVAVKLVLVQSG